MIKIEKETIYSTSICSNKILKLTVFNFDTQSKLILTRFEKNFLGLKNSIFIELDNNSISENNSFSVESKDKEYFDIIKRLLMSLSDNPTISSNKKDTKRYGKIVFSIFEQGNFILIKRNMSNQSIKINSIELAEGERGYNEFDILAKDLFAQYDNQNNQKVKKIVYKSDI